MKRTNTVLLGLGVAILALLAVALPLGVAVAQDSGTPTPFSGGLGDLIIPTATPGASGADTGGGLTIPTATPIDSGGGFNIPTSTPAPTAEPAGPELPPLSDEQLTDLNLRPADLPAAFAANRTVETFVNADTVAQIAEFSPELADEFETITADYGWTHSIGMTYAACQPDLPINEIYSEVAQLPSADAARAFFDDPAAQAVFTNLGYTIEPATGVHGWLMTLGPFEGACFPQEIAYSLNFDYWGLFLIVSMTANADTDPALVTGLLDQLAPVIIAHADSLAATPFPPTPVPGAAVTVEEVTEPTQAVVPPTWTPAAPVSDAPTLAEVERLMPSGEELGLSASDYTLNNDLSSSGTAQDWVALWQEIGLADIASALAQNAAQNGMIGQIARVWDTGGTCPPGMAISLEIDVTLFETPAGADAFLFDPAYLQALGNLGVITEQSGGALISSLTTPTECGTMMTYAKSVASGPFIVGSSVIVYQDIDRAEVMPVLDLVNQFMVDKLAEAGF
jgi:hypothetical protein